MIERDHINDDNINIRALVLRYSQYWYYIIISISICLAISFLYNRYTVPGYSVSTTLLIRDDNNTQMGAENILATL